MSDFNEPFVDRAGRCIRFEYTMDSEPANRGIIDDRLEAWHGDAKVGYIRCEYMTQESFDTFLPTVYNYASQFAGIPVMPPDHPELDPRTASPEIVDRMAKVMVAYKLLRHAPEAPLRGYIELDHLVQSQPATVITSKLHASYDDLRNRIGRPFVSYVCVDENPHQGVVGDNRLLGIGTELYRRMAITLGERGLELHSSTLQSNEAKSIWKRFTETGWAVAAGDRYKLDVARLTHDATLSL